jgi:hypothetical protein
VTLQAIISFTLLMREFRRKLAAPPAAAGGAADGALPVAPGPDAG